MFLTELCWFCQKKKRVMVYNKAFKYPRYKKVFIDEITKTGFSDMRKKLQIANLQS